MKALVTGCAGFIGSTLAERLLGRRRRRRRHRLLHRLLPAADQGAEPRGAARRSRASGSSSRRIQDADLPALLARLHARVPPGRAGRRAQELGPRLRDLHGEQHRSDAGLLEALRRPSDRAARLRLELVGLRRRVAMPMREDALPQPVSPYGVTKLAAEQLCYLYYVNYGVPTVSLRYFTVYGPRQRPDMAFHRFLRAAIRGEPITLYGDGEQTRDFTFVADAVARRSRPATRGVPGRVYNIGGGSRVSVNQVLEMIGRVAGRRPRRRRRAGAEGRHARTPTPTRRWRAPSSASRRPSASRQGLAAEYQWLTGITCELHATASPSRSSLRLARRDSSRSSRRWRRAPAGRAARVPAGTAEPDKFLFDKGTEALNRQEVADRARVLQAGRSKPTPQSPLSARRQARHRRHLSRRRHVRSAGARDQRVPRVPVLLPDQPPRRLRAVQARRWRTSARCARRSATRRRRATRSSEFETFVDALSEQQPDAGGRRRSCARRRTA